MSRKKLKYLVIHCAATPEGRDVKAATVVSWHTNSVSKGGRGWSKPGYSDIIELDGKIVNIVGYNYDGWVDVNEVTNGVQGINSEAQHVCYIGGCDATGKNAKDTRTTAQLISLENLLKLIVSKNRNIIVAGHNQFNPGKACPSFDVPKWLRSIGVAEKNIYKG